MSVPPDFWMTGHRGDDPRGLRHAFGTFPTGITVVTTCTPEGRRVGMTINSFASLSMDPPLLLWSLATRSPSLEAFSSCRHFAVNVLAATQEELCWRFASSDVADKFAGIHCEAGLGGSPLLPGVVAQFECLNEMQHPGGDHLIIVGRVEQYRWRKALPLVFHGGQVTELRDRDPQRNPG